MATQRKNGPSKTPAKLRLMTGRGNGRDSGGRLVEPTPEFRRIPPTKPAGMTPAASEHWDLVITELTRLELVKDIDAGSLAALCETYAVWSAARDARDRDGLTIVQPNGRTVTNPAVVVERQASAEYRAWCREFGLTPSAESGLRVKGAPDGESNPFAGTGTED